MPLVCSSPSRSVVVKAQTCCTIKLMSIKKPSRVVIAAVEAGLVRERLADIDQEHGAGYAWYGYSGTAPFAEFDRWQSANN